MDTLRFDACEPMIIIITKKSIVDFIIILKINAGFDVKIYGVTRIGGSVVRGWPQKCITRGRHLHMYVKKNKKIYWNKSEEENSFKTLCTFGRIIGEKNGTGKKKTTSFWDVTLWTTDDARNRLRTNGKKVFPDRRRKQKYVSAVIGNAFVL